MVRGRQPTAEPYIVAAVDRNHEGRPAVARRLVALAVDAGAHAVKFTVWPADENEPSLPLSAWRVVKREARGRIDLVLAPRDSASFAFARRLGPDAYQIDPDVIGDHDLVRAIARERRPVHVVAAGCTTPTLAGVIRDLRGCPVVLLHGIFRETLSPARARLRYIPWLASRFRTPVGYFGPEPGIGWAFVAVALGATVIEKRFTLDRALAGAEHSSSIDRMELGALVAGCRQLRGALAPIGDRRVLADELEAIESSARSLVASRRLKHGHRLRASDITVARVAGGLGPRLRGWLTNRRLRYDIDRGEPITFGLVDLA
jgi:N-acetylneuraminate synthase